MPAYIFSDFALNEEQYVDGWSPIIVVDADNIPLAEKYLKEKLAEFKKMQAENYAWWTRRERARKAHKYYNKEVVAIYAKFDAENGPAPKSPPYIGDYANFQLIETVCNGVFVIPQAIE